MKIEQDLMTTLKVVIKETMEDKMYVMYICYNNNSYRRIIII